MGGLFMLTLSKKILVAIDGSPQSDKAAEEAIRLAAQSGVKLRSHVSALIVLARLKATSFTDFFPAKPPIVESD